MKIYQENIKKYDAQLLKLTKLLNIISVIRLAFFIVITVIIIFLFNLNLFVLVSIILLFSIVCFVILIKRYNKTAFVKKHTMFLKEINESEILRENCKLEQFDTGRQFIKQNHSYSSDLDIFGQHSVFQLVNRTTTESGMTLLSEWLSEPAFKDEILDRQEAVKEISKNLEWRQGFQASGLHFQNNKSDYNKLLAWIESPVVLLKKQKLYLAVTIMFSALSLLNLYFFIVNLTLSNGYVYLISLIIVMYVNYLILRKAKPMADDIVENAQNNLTTIKAYQTLVNKIESEDFSSKKLNQLKTFLIKNKCSASKEIKKLCRLLDFSHQRGIKRNPISGNLFYSILNSFLLFDIYLVFGIEKWKSRNIKSFESWSVAISEFEVINSFAGFHYSNPSYAFPEIIEKSNYVHFELLGHPLIDPNKRVCNDFYTEAKGDVVLITGSNMGGKSTFLRTVGINLVLSLAGAPCCARNAQVSNLKIFTSMRTQDNLKEGVSSFFAELNRIEKMLNLIKNSKNVFFLLDEMFKGTNSNDRHKGGFSLISQVSQLNTAGIVATHDIDLAKLLGDKMLVRNYSFNSEIKNDSMIFSYKLHTGICNDFNASELMKKSGIEILSNISEK